MENKPFNVVDKDSFSVLKGAELLSVYKWSKHEYLCEDEDGYYKIKQKGSIIFIGYSETENGMSVKPVLAATFKSALILGPWSSCLDIIEIMKYMDWTCDENYMWLG